MARYCKVYEDSQDKKKCFKIFKDNVAFMEAFNNVGNKPYKLGINQFTDLTNQEFKATINRYKNYMCPTITRTSMFKYENATVVPSAMDWRTKGAITPIKDQGQCSKHLIIYSHTSICMLVYTQREISKCFNFLKVNFLCFEQVGLIKVGSTDF